MRDHPIFALPAYRLGPYQMKPVAAARKQFGDKRRKSENDWSAGIVRIDENLGAAETLRYFLRHLIVTIHYRSGLNDNCDEEAYTHSLAGGLVELAHRNETFWVALQGILSAQYAPKENWEATAAGFVTEEVAVLPDSVRYGKRECILTWRPSYLCDKEEAYGFYTPKTGPIELSNGLRGSNLPLVAIHEVIHFLHECEGLTDRSKEVEFRDGQLRIFPRFIAQNPQFWHWWLDKARRPERPMAAVAGHSAPTGAILEPAYV